MREKERREKGGWGERKRRIDGRRRRRRRERASFSQRVSTSSSCLAFLSRVSRLQRPLSSSLPSLPVALHTCAYVPVLCFLSRWILGSATAGRCACRRAQRRHTHRNTVCVMSLFFCHYCFNMCMLLISFSFHSQNSISSFHSLPFKPLNCHSHSAFFFPYRHYKPNSADQSKRIQLSDGTVVESQCVAGKQACLSVREVVLWLRCLCGATGPA